MTAATVASMRPRPDAAENGKLAISGLSFIGLQ